MCPRAGEALYAAGRLAAEEGLSPLFGEFLMHGLAALPGGRRHGFRGLHDWQGVGELRRVLGRVLEARGSPQVLIASRSSTLMRLAARLLVLRCRRVLTTDLEWPGYSDVLAREARRFGRELVTAPVSALAFGGTRADELVSAVLDCFCRQGCDGAFLSAVSYLGVRLPADALCERLAERRGTRFVVIDGSQATAHAPMAGLASCDLFLTGCHKWLCAHLPVGVAVCPRPRSAGLIRATAAEMLASLELDDPLLRFTGELEADEVPGYGETVAVSCLFTARAAAEEFLMCGGAAERFPTLIRNAEGAVEAARGTGWGPLRPHTSLHSGMLLLAPHRDTARVPPDELRRRFEGAGVVLTAYETGRIRLSMPSRPWEGGQLERLREALRLA